MTKTATRDEKARLFAFRIKTRLDTLRVFTGTLRARQLVLGLFVIQAVILVFVTHIGVPPDETNHINFIEYYAHHSLSPIFSHQAPTYSLGDKTRELDYLYHYVMSLLYRVLPFSATGKYLVMRLCSVVFGLSAFIVLAKILKKVGLSATVITVGLLILTNLPMVLMMSSAVNNDVLVWLGMTLGILMLLRLWEQPRVLDLLWLFTLAIAGGLVKRTLLPLGLLFGVLGLIVLIRHFRTLTGQLKQIDWRIALVIVALLVSTGLFAERVGGNLVRYHTLTPSCEQVDGTAACSGFWANVRARDLAALPHEVLMPVPVFALAWFYQSLSNVVDVQTQYWLHSVQPAIPLTPLLVTLLVGGLAYGFYYEYRHRKSDRKARWRLYILLISLCFMVVHVFVNYESYTDIKFFGVALNGRYIIPSLLPFIGLTCFYWAILLRNQPRRLAVIAATVVIAIVLGSGLQLMLRNTQLFLDNPALAQIVE